MSFNAIIGIVGMRGHGKSTKMKEILVARDNVIMIDTLSEHGAWCPLLAPDVPKAVGLIERGEFSCNSVMIPPDSDAHHVAFEYYAKAAFSAARKKGEVTLACEEVDWYCQPGWENPGLNLLIQYGRHGPVNLVWTARNIGSVSRKLTSETDAYILFRVQEPLWLDSMQDRLGQDVRERVENLQRFQYIIVSESGTVDGETCAERKETQGKGIQSEENSPQKNGGDSTEAP